MERILVSADIRDCAASIENMVVDVVRAGRNYDLILGDDASGRIPALVTAKVLNTLRNNQGLKQLPIRFARVTIAEESDSLKEIILRLNEYPLRVLLVTEYIMSGSRCEAYKEFFDRRGIQLDVACVGIGPKALSDNPVLERMQAQARIHGGYEVGFPLYQKDHLSGLHSGRPQNERVVKKTTGRHGYANYMQMFNDRTWREFRQCVLMARKDVLTLSAAILEKIEARDPLSERAA